MSENLIASQLAARRKQLGWKVNDVAQRVGRQASRISEIETGHANPSLNALMTVGEVLGLQLMFVPKDRANEIMALLGHQSAPTVTSNSTESVFDEVFIPDPDDSDADPSP
jgi:transcriptional regulator with XRE-family HTH domain